MLRSSAQARQRTPLLPLRQYAFVPFGKDSPQPLQREGNFRAITGCGDRKTRSHTRAAGDQASRSAYSRHSHGNDACAQDAGRGQVGSPRSTRTPAATNDAPAACGDADPGNSTLRSGPASSQASEFTHTTPRRPGRGPPPPGKPGSKGLRALTRRDPLPTFRCGSYKPRPTSPQNTTRTAPQKLIRSRFQREPGLPGPAIPSRGPGSTNDERKP